MPLEHALILTVASRRDFQLLLWCVSGLLLLAVLISPIPFLQMIITFVLLAVSLQFPAILFACTPSESCAISLARDGELSIEANQGERAEGVLSGTQWCNRHLAVLRYRSDNAVHHCVLIAARQSPDSFRQLCVWLRHNYSQQEKDQP